MTTMQFDRFHAGPIDEIDAAIWSGDMFINRENLAAMRDILARWERGLNEAESILKEIENERTN